MTNKILETENFFIIKGRLENSYKKSDTENNSNSCNKCMRRYYSYPDTCNDGWQMGDSSWIDRGSTCMNFLKMKEKQNENQT